MARTPPTTRIGGTASTVPGAVAVGDVGGAPEANTGPILDTFTAADATAINGRTPSPTDNGSTWNGQGANIYDNGMRCDASLDGAYIEYGFSDQVVQARVNAGGADNRFGIVGRRTGTDPLPDTGYVMNVKPASNEIAILRYDSQSPTSLASETLSMSLSTTYLCRLEIIGDQIEGYIDDSLVVGPVSDSTHAIGTDCGLVHFLHTDNALRFEDFQVGLIVNIDLGVADLAVDAENVSISQDTPIVTVNLGVADFAVEAVNISISQGSPIFESYTIGAGSRGIPIAREKIKNPKIDSITPKFLEDFITKWHNKF